MGRAPLKVTVYLFDNKGFNVHSTANELTFPEARICAVLRGSFFDSIPQLCYSKCIGSLLETPGTQAPIEKQVL